MRRIGTATKVAWWALALCLLLIALTSSASPSSAGLTLPRPLITAVEVYRVNAPETLGADAVKIDGAGNRFDAVVHFAGNDTYIWVDKYDRAGALIGNWALLAPPDPTQANKWDSVSLTASGNDLLIGGISHLLTTRNFVRSLGVIPGVYVPFASSGPQEDGAGAYLPTEGTTACPTASEIAQATAAILQPYIQSQINAAVANIVGNIKPKARAALDEAFQGGSGSYPVYRQLVDTSYQGASAALRDYRPPTTTQTPTPGAKP